MEETPQDLPRSSRSPWAFSPGAGEVTVAPGPGAVAGELSVPGSKSLTNRALILAALAEGPSELAGILQSDDSYWCVEALRALGVPTAVAGDAVRLAGCGGRWPVRQGRLYLGSAGTLARFLPGALAAAPAGEWELHGSSQLSGRPLAPLVEALRTLGARIDYLSAYPGLPIRVRGGGLEGGVVTLSGRVSSQFLSGLLMAAPSARGAVTVRLADDLVQPAYVGMTLQLMEDFGARVEADPGYATVRVAPGPYRGRRLRLEADASSACYFLALAALTGGRLRVTNVGYDSLQPDARFVDVLARMGCEVVRGQGWLEVAGPGRLRGGLTLDLKAMSDQALTAGVLAACADAPVTVANVAHIRRHESDRIAVFCENMGRLGIRAEERPDGFAVYPALPRPRQPVDPRDDHRQAMAFALLGARVAGVRILDPGCVSKTFPGYFAALARLGLQIAYR